MIPLEYEKGKTQELDRLAREGRTELILIRRNRSIAGRLVVGVTSDDFEEGSQ